MDILEKIKKDFYNYGLQYSETVVSDNYKKNNRIVKKIQELYNKAKSMNRLDVFKEFITDDNAAIRYLTATCILKYDPELAISVLKELKEVPGIISTYSTSTIDMWEKGMLNHL